MFGNMRKLFLVAILFVSGCAKPVYESIVNSQPEDGLGRQKISDCRAKFLNSGYCVLWQWEKVPSATTKGVLVFKIVRANALDDSPVPVELEETAFVFLWMPSMGHGSTPTQTEKVDIGSYRTSDVFFVMPGQWEIKFQLKRDNSVIDEAVVSITI